MSSPSKRASEDKEIEETPVRKVRKLSMSFLKTAIKKGNVDKVEEFLKQKDEFKEEGKKMTPLHYAALGENVEIVKLLNENGYGTIDAKNRNNKTPLHLALENESVDIIKYLMENGSENCLSPVENNNQIRYCFLENRLDILKCIITKEKIPDSMIYYSVTENRLEILKYLVQCGDKINKTPSHFFFLHKAAAIGNLEIVKLFFNAKFDIFGAKNLSDKTPLYYAVTEGHMEIVEFLIENRVKNKLSYKEFCDIMRSSIKIGRLNILKALVPNDYISNYDLYFAALNGRLEILKYLLECGVKINSDSDDSGTPLHGAVEGGHLDIVKYLLENGHKFDVLNSDGQTALDSAVLNGKVEVINYFIESLSVIIIKERHFYDIIRAGHLELLKFVIDKGCGVINTKIKGNVSLLHCSAHEGQLDIFKYLLANGAEVNCLTHDNKSALIFAIKAGHTEIVKELLAHGAENKKYKIAAKDVKEEILLLLVKAQHPMKNYFGRRKPFVVAAELGYWKLVENLITFGVDINSRTKRHQTALDLAILNQNSKMVRVLLAAGANPKGNPKNKNSPLDYAIRQEWWPELEKTLIQIVKDLLDYLPKEDLEHTVISSINLAVKEKTSINLINVLLSYDFNNKYKLTIHSLDCESSMFVALVDHVQKLETLIEFQDLLLRKHSCHGSFYVNKMTKMALISKIVLLKSLPGNSNIGVSTHERFVTAFQLGEWNTRCREEINCMKNTKVVPEESEMTYYDFLAKPLYKLENCVTNANLMQNFEHSNGFKMFEDFFKRRAKRIRDRSKYIDSCRKSLYYMISDNLKIFLPSEIVDNICEYLTALEVERLPEAYPC